MNGGSYSLEHALHNERACKYLAEDNFNDWVVTTAFYSAIHFVEHFLYPLQKGDREFESFDEFYTVTHIDSHVGKHAARTNQVQRHLITASGEFKWLKSTAFTTRYNKYDVGDSIKSRALDSLNTIKGVCMSEEEKEEYLGDES